MYDHVLRAKTLSFLNELKTPEGGFSNTPGTVCLPQPTLSVLKTLAFFGRRCDDPDGVFDYVLSLYDEDTGGFKDPTQDKPTVFATALGLLNLKAIGAEAAFMRYQDMAVRYMEANAVLREEYFMLIGVCDECRLSYQPQKAIQYFKAQQGPDGLFYPEGSAAVSVLHNAICASALLRSGEVLISPEAIGKLMLGAQNYSGGFSEPGEKPSLWVSYCVMRLLDLMQLRPNCNTLQTWVLSLETPDANQTYQALSLLHWVAEPIIQAAQSGNTALIKDWLISEGSPNIRSLKGMTPLMAAAARGQSAVVKLLLSPHLPNVSAANPKLRYEDGDLSAILFAGQSGDLETVKHLLANNSDSLYDYSRINGHNVLLQAAFFGSAKHLELASWLLEHLKEVLKPSPQTDEESFLSKERHRLLTMTNVRGYTPLTMAQLWGNQPMADLFSQYDHSTEADRTTSWHGLLNTLAAENACPPEEEKAQRISDQFIELISDGLKKVADLPEEDHIKVHILEEGLLRQLQAFMDKSDLDINRLGGPLSQTPLIAAVTGTDKTAEMAAFRLSLVQFLLAHGADPDKPEKHPMAVDAVIRAAVLNHFEILQCLADHMKPLAFAAALNEAPPINGQTALQDTVHRALTAKSPSLEKHLEQIRFCISRGARIDIEDHTGRSPETLARSALSDSVFKANAELVLKALGLE